jgi:hypothetical protein
MIEAAFVAERRLSAEQSLEVLATAIRTREPFSFVRMGDGEACLLGAFRDDPAEIVMGVLKRHWGWDEFNEGETETLRELLLESANTADLLGTFDTFDRAPSRFSECGVRI